MQDDPPRTPTPSTISKEDSIDSILKRPTATVELELVLNREGGQPFGLNIAGGMGSSPFVDNDQSIFVSKVVSGGLADKAGLRVINKKVNCGSDCVIIKIFSYLYRPVIV